MSGIANGLKPKRYRLPFTFWLNVQDDTDCALADECSAMIEKRQLTPMIRNGLRLILDLKAGKTEVLEQLFPWVLEGRSVVIETPSQDDLHAHLARLERLILSQPQPQKQVSTRRDDDDLLDTLNITQSKSDENAGFNMMISMSGLTGKWGDLPTDVLEYGKAKGRIPAAAEMILKERNKPVMADTSVQNMHTGNPKPIAGANITLAPPPDDEIEIEGW